MDYFNKLGVRRPPTLEDIPARFDILDPVTTVLEGALEIKVLKSGPRLPRTVPLDPSNVVLIMCCLSYHDSC